MLVDADPYRPRIHNILGIPINPGLIDVLTDQMGVHSVIRLVDEIPDLKVITAGKLDEGGSEPGFWKIDQVLSSLKEQADIIIVDGPPLMVPDGSILASKVDGVLMVMQPGSIRQDVAKAAIDQLNRSKARTIGVVLNRITRGEADGYAAYSYYSHYYVDSQSMRQSHRRQQVKIPIAIKILERIKREFPSNDR
jgi:Mrp family chromosome partitioning ATPase